MKIGIAGYGSIGRYVEGVFSRFHDITLYDPPLGLGRIEDLDEVDYAILCVPTPTGEDGVCDTSIVEELVARINPRRAIVCQSTVSIGTTDRLTAKYRKPLVYVPEWAGESMDHPYRRLERRGFLIYGGRDPAASAVQELYETGYGRGVRHHVVEPRVAEVVKYMENAYLAMKVAFCNEFFDLCGAVGADYEEVRSLWLEDWRVGASHTSVTPERGYGGKCLPKDVAAVCASGRELGAAMEIMEAVQSANARHRLSVAEATPEASFVPA
jgi:UDPglucose 6-dehydrogenase